MFRHLPPAGNKITIQSLVKAFLLKRECDTIKTFEEDLMNFLKVKYCYLTTSGTTALFITLCALKNLSDKNEVIVPAYTCPSVLAAVIKAGLKPVLCDLLTNKPILYYTQLEKRVTDKTLAIITVHLFGILEDTSKIDQLTSARHIFHIEDSAQILSPVRETSDAICNTQMVPGTTGDVGILSFGRGKPLTLMHGGAIITSSDIIAKALSEKISTLEEHNIFEKCTIILKSFLYSLFFHPRLYYFLHYFPFLHLGKTFFNLNFKTKKIDSFTAALGRCTIDNIVHLNKMRAEIEQLFVRKLSRFRDLFLNDEHRGFPLLRLPLLLKNNRDRCLILAELNKRGLGATGMYPAPLNLLENTKSYCNGNGSYANAQSFAERIITLPLHSYVTEKDIDVVKNVMEKIIHSTNDA